MAKEWLCFFCGTRNSGLRNTCAYCGQPKKLSEIGEATKYSEYKKEINKYLEKCEWELVLKIAEEAKKRGANFKTLGIEIKNIKISIAKRDDIKEKLSKHGLNSEVKNLIEDLHKKNLKCKAIKIYKEILNNRSTQLEKLLNYFLNLDEIKYSGEDFLNLTNELTKRLELKTKKVITNVFFRKKNKIKKMLEETKNKVRIAIIISALNRLINYLNSLEDKKFEELFEEIKEAIKERDFEYAKEKFRELESLAIGDYEKENKIVKWKKFLRGYEVFQDNKNKIFLGVSGLVLTLFLTFILFALIPQHYDKTVPKNIFCLITSYSPWKSFVNLIKMHSLNILLYLLHLSIPLITAIISVYATEGEKAGVVFLIGFFLGWVFFYIIIFVVGAIVWTILHLFFMIFSTFWGHFVLYFLMIIGTIYLLKVKRFFYNLKMIRPFTIMIHATIGMIGITEITIIVYSFLNLR